MYICCDKSPNYIDRLLGRSSRTRHILQAFNFWRCIAPLPRFLQERTLGNNGPVLFHDGGSSRSTPLNKENKKMGENIFIL